MDNIKIPYLPELETCCGCLSLREGAKMFGVISLLGSIYMCLEIFATIIMISVNPDYVAEGAGILLFAILVHSVHIGTSASLLFGVYKERNKPMFGWLITAVMVALLEAFVVPSIYIRVLIFHKLIEVNYKLVLVTIIMLIDDIYGWLVVYSYYRTLARPRQDYVLKIDSPMDAEGETL